MMNFYPLKAILLLIVFSFSAQIYAQKVVYNDSWGEQGFSIVSKSKGNLTVNYSVTEFDIVRKNQSENNEVHIKLPNHFLPNEVGMPDLPGSGRYIAIPNGAKASLSIKNVRTEVIENVELAPAAPIPFDKEEMSDHIEKNMETYSKNAFYPAEPIAISEKTIIRGIEAIILGVTPFQYNPVTKELKIYKDIEMEISFEGGTDMVGEERLRTPHFDPILNNIFLNYSILPDVDYGKRYRNSNELEGCEYLIVIPNDPEWRPYAEQIKEWRIKQGIITKVMSLEEIGQTTPDGLRTFFHNAYNTWDIPPVAVLLMADYGNNPQNNITAHTVYHSYEWGNAITDNKYADVNEDNLPDMVFARMAAETVDQARIMTSKMLDYESAPPTDEDYYKKPITALGWQTERWFQLCSEVVGGYWRGQGKEPVRINALYQPWDIPGSVWSSTTTGNTSAVVDMFGPNGLGYIPASPMELGGWAGGNAQMIIDAINTGAFAIQHRDHGYEDGWGEPDFSTAHINQLTNIEKLIYVFSINCSTGRFDYPYPCFGEAFHRYTYNGENAGALGFLAPTQVSYSFLNDCFVWGVYDFMDPDFMPAFGVNSTVQNYEGNWMPAFGNVNGKYFLSQSSWVPNNYTWEEVKVLTYQMFTAHGGAFMRLFTEVPQELEIAAPAEIMMGTTEIEISCPVGTTIACTINDVIIAVETATDPVFVLTLPAIDSLTEITLTATKQNYYRYTSTISTIIGELPKPVNLQAQIEFANHVILTWESPEDKGLLPVGYNVYKDDLLLEDSPIKGTFSYIDIVDKNDEYKYYVTALYESNMQIESEPCESIVVAIDGMCIAPGIFDVKVLSPNDIRISWEAPAYEGLALLGYNVYRDKEQINQEIIAPDTFEYIDEEELAPGLYCYTISVAYEDCEDIVFAPLEICVEPVGINDIENKQSVRVYPNPANSQITVVAENMERITIFNIAGKLIKEIECRDYSIDIPVSDFENGIYLLQINTGDRITVKRVSIIR
ncbi:MAG: C25 family cysteine peptidase [Bacteroidales bacterium]|jgi:hypothetical protein|nr:C25 family cysteine peptidase [Bacteroidales bacterium]